MTPAWQTLAVLAAMMVLFVTQVIPLSMTALMGILVLHFLGILTLTEAFSGFSQPVIVLFGSMFVLGGAVFQTGLANRLGNLMVRVTGKGEASLMAGTMAAAAVLSSFASNTGTTAMLVPVVLGICFSASIPASRQMMPLAFAAGLGGIITLVGTPPNLIVTGVLRGAGHPGFGFFEFARIGVPLALAGGAYMLLAGRRLLPKADPVEAIRHAEPFPHRKEGRTARMWTSGAILLAVLVFMALDIEGLPLAVIALAGAVLSVLTGCIEEQQAFYSVDWRTIFLFAGMLPVATAMEKTGAGMLVADGVLGIIGDHTNGHFVLAIVFLASSLLSLFMSNTASAALLAPIGMGMADRLGADPRAILIAVAVGASCAFASPVGTPPNALVLGPGRYRFADYLKVGGGLTAVCFLVSVLLLPWLWPLF